MKKLSNFSKNKKVLILLSSIVVVCGIAIGAMYATGVFPGQTKGMNLSTLPKFVCANPHCDCHKHDTDSFGSEKNTCGECSKCYIKIY